MQRSFAFSVDIILSCERDLNHVQAYIGCLSVLQRTQVVAELAVVAVKDAMDLLDGRFFFTWGPLWLETNVSDACARRLMNSRSL